MGLLVHCLKKISPSGPTVNKYKILYREVFHYGLITIGCLLLNYLGVVWIAMLEVYIIRKPFKTYENTVESSKSVNKQFVPICLSMMVSALFFMK